MDEHTAGETGLLGEEPPEEAWLGRARALLAPRGLAVELVRYARFGHLGEGSTCHALLTVADGQVVSEGRGTTPREAVMVALRSPRARAAWLASA